MMKKLAMVVVMFIGMYMAGCNTLVETWPERCDRLQLQNNLETRILAEDWDYFWLQERCSHLSQWHPLVGY